MSGDIIDMGPSGDAEEMFEQLVKDLEHQVWFSFSNHMSCSNHAPSRVGHVLLSLLCEKFLYSLFQYLKFKAVL